MHQLHLFLLPLFCLTEGYLNNGLLAISITRHHKGDIFIAEGGKCHKDLCASTSGGTADSTGNSGCECRCSPNRPVFRDDLNTCVDDIQECSLVPFASSSVIRKIPYVFLPLKGQIVYPSADIIISDAKTPVCVVSGGQFLGQNGWVNLRNRSGADIPFTLFRDEGKTYLQWLGESTLRMALEGRIILVHLLCKNPSVAEEPEIFSPCIAFRVAGNPSVKEMMFTTDVHLKEENGGGLKMREYVAIGVCSLLLAIVYVAAVFLYLHIKKRKNKGNKRAEEDAHLTLGEEGVIKSNPLLQATRHLTIGGHDNAGYISESNSCCSDVDQTSDLLRLDEEDPSGSQNMQTSVIIHPCELHYGETMINQESTNIEKLPEENVSIVETLEAKENHPETVRGMGCVNGRRKLYFNPSYFEPDLLKAPPPAAMEFLIKIREVIAIAKHKMSAKKFSPSLLGIPEEDGNSALSVQDFFLLNKCETGTSPVPEKPLKDNFHLLPNELSWSSDTKQKIIRKWLEDVPIMILQTEERKTRKPALETQINKSNLWETNQENYTKGPHQVPTPPARQEKRKTKGRAPPIPTLKSEEPKTEKKDFMDVPKNENGDPPRPPPMPSFKRENEDVPRVQSKDFVPPAVAKNLMDAVIQELTSYKKNDKISKLKQLPDKGISDKNTEDLSTENTTIEEVTKSEHSTKVEDTTQQDDHEYEIILLNTNLPSTESKDLKIYNLPEILSKNDKTEGYSLVSEVYVNDGYSCCSGESPPSSYTNTSIASEKVHYDRPNERTGRLTIHVTDTTDRGRNSASESDNFEPDTLDRKPRKLAKKRDEERYSNQKFQECYINSNKSENFADSLERPSIMLKTNGTFKRNSEMGDLLRDFTWSNVETVGGSLREIYEAKAHKRRTETSSLIAMDTTHGDHDRHSTLSWSEERRNKLLHRGIVLHIKDKDGKKVKRKNAQIPNPPKVPSRPPKPTPSPSSVSLRSNCASPSNLPLPPRGTSPPLPPPRTLPSPSRSTSDSPIPKNRIKTPGSSSPSNSIQRSKLSRTSPSCTPPPRPPKTVDGSPLLPPRKPPLPPKNVKRPAKFAGRPLPPLPRPKDSSSPLPYGDPESTSTHSGASTDSLNSSDYEEFYTIPYEEEEVGRNKREECRRVAVPDFGGNLERTGKAIPHRQEDSGYLSTDSDSCCRQLMFSRNSENSETEESLCDGASESGGESIATDSFFYGNFKKKTENGGHSEVSPYTLRLSDVEVNSDPERRCIPIMVRP